MVRALNTSRGTSARANPWHNRQNSSESWTDSNSGRRWSAVMPDGPAAQPRRDTRKLRTSGWNCCKSTGRGSRGTGALQWVAERMQGLGHCVTLESLCRRQFTQLCQTKSAFGPALDRIDGCPCSAKLCSTCVLRRSLTGDQQLNPLASREPGKPLDQLALGDETSASWAEQQHSGQKEKQFPRPAEACFIPLLRSGLLLPSKPCALLTCTHLGSMWAMTS